MGTEKDICIVTTLGAEEGYQVEHRVTYTYGEKGIEVESAFINRTRRMVTLDLFTSFSIDNLSPLQKDDVPYQLKLHRCQGGWWKNIPDGGSFTAPKAYLSVSGVGFWDVCQNITGMFGKYTDMQPRTEQDLPIIFNEWCTTWGRPSHESMTALAEKIKELPAVYAVIDAGWSKMETEAGDPQGGNGTWECNEKQFPYGLKQLSGQLKSMGLLMGIWMEFEVTTKGSEVHEELHIENSPKI